MKFKVEKGSLLAVLQNLISIVPGKTTLQVITNFLLTLKGQELRLSATDLDISMNTSLQVKGEGDGSLLLNAKKLFEIVRELPDGEIAFDVQENVAQIKTLKGFAKITGTASGDFPAAPDVDTAVSFSVPSVIIKKMVEKTSFAVSADETRQSLNGILWDIRDKEMRMVATDGHRLGYAAYKHSAKIESSRNVILPPKAMNQLCRLLSEDEIKEVQSVIGTSHVSFTAGASTITTKLIQGPYPNYDQVIPKANNKRASIDCSELIAALRRVSILASGKTHQVKYAFQKDQLTLSVVNRDFGAEAKEDVPISYSADALDIGFNAGFFIEILKLVNTPRVRLSLNSAISACLFHPEEDEKLEIDYFFLLMPLRLLSDA